MSPAPHETNLPPLHIDWHRVLGADLLGLDSVELSQLNAAIRSHSRRSIRLRQTVSQHELPFEVTTVPWNASGRWICDPAVRPGAFLQYAAGDYYIQDAGSLLALSLCRLQPNQKVCDVCAAPGGKATGLLEQLRHTGFLIANEVIHGRINVLHYALCRTGYGNFATTSLDVTQLADRWQHQFDCVLVDAPCSGQSLVGRDKQSMAAFSDHQINHSAGRQRRILGAAAKLVKTGGKLVYSTCTFSVAENEQIIEQFLLQNPSWRAIEFPDLQPWASPLLPGCYRLWPHRDGCDGAFGVALECPTESGSTDADVLLPHCLHSQPPTKYAVAGYGRSTLGWQPWRGKLSQLGFLALECDHVEDYAAWQRGDTISLMQHQIPGGAMTRIQSALTLAHQRNGRLEPDYASAVSLLPNLPPTHRLDLDSKQASQYLQGESIQVDGMQAFQGWCRADWLGRQLGWGKFSGNQLKNHLPKGLRQPILLAE